MRCHVVWSDKQMIWHYLMRPKSLARDCSIIPRLSIEHLLFGMNLKAGQTIQQISKLSYSRMCWSLTGVLDNRHTMLYSKLHQDTVNLEFRGWFCVCITLLFPVLSPHTLFIGQLLPRKHLRHGSRLHESCRMVPDLYVPRHMEQAGKLTLRDNFPSYWRCDIAVATL
jgi:hypothetical protein